MSASPLSTRIERDILLSNFSRKRLHPNKKRILEEKIFKKIFFIYDRNSIVNAALKLKIFTFNVGQDSKYNFDASGNWTISTNYCYTCKLILYCLRIGSTKLSYYYYYLPYYLGSQLKKISCQKEIDLVLNIEMDFSFLIPIKSVNKKSSQKSILFFFGFTFYIFSSYPPKRKRLHFEFIRHLKATSFTYSTDSSRGFYYLSGYLTRFGPRMFPPMLKVLSTEAVKFSHGLSVADFS
ncbi:hypothetical protein BpHYR1_010513 [Brachionus plicatilis]|uniref:Uncharacterized protein n=1 Tax=Brachionus plicatilis TaxID=10195 RepID=A0A3M7TAH7_BRAPC|nr:hypothetical protein BpHYR1_010513 [Brachionus plicatilis]